MIYDFIVIGSGFGGSVSALRLAEKGYRVAVLEKGKRYEPNDFAKNNWNLRKYLWLPQLKLYGIQVLSLVKHAFILHGAGVGGGSLVYANQLLVPPDEVFENKEWGPGDWKEKLATHYKTAQTMLGANPSPTVGKADELLREVGIELTGKDTFHKNDVGIFFGKKDVTVPDPYFDGKGPDRTGCTFCGACMVGCRVGAKNTLDKNYLYLAEKLGVDIIPETEVTAIVPKMHGQDGYLLKTRRTTGILHPEKTYETNGVVLSGGVMGTVKLLLDCKDKNILPDLSGQLGKSIRTNSEAILGCKSKEKDANFADQIAITSGIYPDETTHVEVVRYNKWSDLMGGLATILTDGGGKIPRFLRFLINMILHPIKFLKSLWPFGWGHKNIWLLVMQTDDNSLEFDYKRRWWRFGGKSMNSKLPEGKTKAPSYIPIANEIARKMAVKMNGQPMSVWPEVLLDVPTTAHILGGCAMSDSPHKGVVDYSGKVHNYPNMYIVDGSIVPVNLGVNPSLTITALSEYVMSQMPGKNP